MDSPLLSIIVPVHNGESWAIPAVDGILSQTRASFELIAIDDASRDATPNILAERCGEDSRIRVLTHETCLGAGPSRNDGMDIARGKYLLFLDADDLFEPNLVERVVTEAERIDADVVLFGADEFETEGEWRSNRFLLVSDLVPAAVPFNRNDIPNRLFQLCTPEPWTKLFRRDFAMENGLRFQGLQNTNDMLFTLSGLALAARVGAVPDVLVHHRVGRPGSIQASRGRDSLAFLAALRAVKQRLEVEGLFDQLAESFANLVVFHCLFNDDAPASWAEVFAELGVSGLPEHAFWLDGDYERYTRLVLASWEEGNGLTCAYGKDFWYKAALLERADLERSAQRADELQRRVDDAWRETELVKASLSFRVGSTLTAPIRKLRER